MDVHLDLGMSKLALLDSIRRKDYVKEYPTVRNVLAGRDWDIVEGTMWCIFGRGLLYNIRTDGVARDRSRRK